MQWPFISKPRCAHHQHDYQQRNDQDPEAVLNQPISGACVDVGNIMRYHQHTIHTLEWNGENVDGYALITRDFDNVFACLRRPFDGGFDLIQKIHYRLARRNQSAV